MFGVVPEEDRDFYLSLQSNGDIIFASADPNFIMFKES